MTDLLTDLKTAYEKLGYRVSYDLVHTERGDKFQCWNAWKDGVGKQIPDVVTPDLCKEMKDWMEGDPRNWDWQIQTRSTLSKRFYDMFVYKSRADDGYNLITACGHKTEEEAVLAAFLEVTKEKSE